MVYNSCGSDPGLCDIAMVVKCLQGGALCEMRSKWDDSNVLLIHGETI